MAYLQFNLDNEDETEVEVEYTYNPERKESGWYSIGNRGDDPGEGESVDILSITVEGKSVVEMVSEEDMERIEDKACHYGRMEFEDPEMWE